jgi:uncharacterized protein involved in outer membrane biogenesis
MKFLKIIGGLVLVIVILLVVAGFFVANNINGLVKDAVEDVGSSTLKTSVTLGSANLKLMQGRVQLSGLTIANPEGFGQQNIFEMNDIVVSLELASLLDNIVEVKEISVDGMRVVAEQKGTSTNLQALLKNVDSGAQQPSSEPEGEGTALDVLIKVGQLNFTNGSMQLVSDRWGESDLPLPTIKLTSIGGSSGVPPDQLAEKILQPLLKQVISNLEQGIKQLVEGKAKEKLRAKEDELKEKLNSKLGDKLGTDTDSLKSLFSR